MRKLKILFRKNLKMSPGKLAAQAVHAALGLGVIEPLMSVVVLGVSDRKFDNTIKGDEEPSKADIIYVVRDAGLTEVPPGTETCLAFIEEDEE